MTPKPMTDQSREAYISDMQSRLNSLDMLLLHTSGGDKWSLLHGNGLETTPTSPEVAKPGLISHPVVESLCSKCLTTFVKCLCRLQKCKCLTDQKWTHWKDVKFLCLSTKARSMHVGFMPWICMLSGRTLDHCGPKRCNVLCPICHLEACPRKKSTQMIRMDWDYWEHASTMTTMFGSNIVWIRVMPVESESSSVLWSLCSESLSLLPVKVLHEIVYTVIMIILLSSINNSSNSNDGW